MTSAHISPVARVPRWRYSLCACPLSSLRPPAAPPRQLGIPALALRLSAASGAASSPPMPILSPAYGTGYTPRSSTNDLKDIIEDHLEDFFKVYDERFRSTYGPLHPRVRDLMEAYARCGDPHFGFVRIRCCNQDCDAKHELILPFS